MRGWPIRLSVKSLSAVLLLACLARAQQTEDPSQIYKIASPSVGSLVALDSKGLVIWSGTAFFVSADGKLITNYHVIDHAPRLVLRLQDGTEHAVTFVLATDKDKDLAFMQLDAEKSSFLPLACARPPAIGSTVFTIGNPLGMLENTFAQGIISGIRKVDGNALLQTSAPISHGSSGGPLLNEFGEVVGVTTATMGEGQNLNFAVPVAEVCELISKSGSPKLFSSMFTSSLPKIQAVDEGSKPVAEGSPINPHWLSSGSRSVLADPHFYDLEINQREEVLSEIDPRFRSLPPQRRQSYLWAAETANLPRPLVSTNTFSWTPVDPRSKAEFSGPDGLTKTFDTGSIEVEARFPAISLGMGRFLAGHLKITNQSSEEILVVPQTFFLRVTKPKAEILRFEYPSRVSHELMYAMVSANMTTGIALPGDLYRMIGSIPSMAIKQLRLRSGESVEGEVFFENPAGKMREFVLNVFIGETAVLIPFSIAK